MSCLLLNPLPSTREIIVDSTNHRDGEAENPSPGPKPRKRVASRKSRTAGHVPVDAAPAAAPKPKRKSASTQSSATKPRVSARRNAAASAGDPGPAGYDVAQMIATAAYDRAEKRNFEPGAELDDWLAAERDILTHATPAS
jgi:hypothetical protein